MSPYYTDDHVTLYHARWEDVPPDLLRADVLVTDPPYGVGFDYGDGFEDVTGAAYAPVIDRLAAMLPDFEAALVTPGISNIWQWPQPRWVAAWFKPGASGRANLPQPNRPQGGFNEWEPVLAYGAVRMMSDALRLPAVPQVGTGSHPCPKPLDLFRWLVGATDGTILDPYAGSGTTLVAAKSLNRKAIGVECVERYCEVAANRLRQEVLGLVA